MQNPSVKSFLPSFFTKKLVWGFSSAGRAPALHAGGQEFESPNLHHLKQLEPFKIVPSGTFLMLSRHLSFEEIIADLNAGMPASAISKFYYLFCTIFVIFYEKRSLEWQYLIFKH